MKTVRSLLPASLPFLLMMLAGGVLALALLPFAQSPVVFAAPAAMASPAAPESWTAGVTLESSPVYASLAGRLLTGAASFRSNTAVKDIYYIFPASADAKTVISARYLLLKSSGSYAGTTTLALEVYKYDGTLEHAVSAAPLDLSAAPAAAWQDLALSAAAGDLAVPAGDFLAFHFSLSGDPGGSLDLRPIFDVLVQ